MFEIQFRNNETIRLSTKTQPVFAYLFIGFSYIYQKMSSLLIRILKKKAMKFYKVIGVIIFVVAFSNSCNKEGEPFVKEEYTYKSVIIGNQEWMADDLKNNVFCNGDPIPEVKDFSEWSGLETAAWVYVNNDKLKYGTFGKLYNWYAVNDKRNICPCGWHVPSYGEWEELIKYLGGPDVAGGKMKSLGTIQTSDGFWYEPNTGATNSSGFSAIPTGV
ncbi:MAG: hypothetical protein C0397_15205 [Odoribacter sp.]|nr:hypothetical protein [Odoribacter sp.]